MSGSIGVVILAAGASRRLGTAKQLLLYEGQPLVRRAAETALAAACGPIVVVLGAQASAIEPALAGLPLRTVHNASWAAGPGSSIRTGVAALLAADATAEGTTLDAVLLLLADQPRVGPSSLARLIARFRSDDRPPIVAARYSDTVGVPALFARGVVADLLALPAAAGAKSLIERPGSRAVTVDLPEASVDIDTAEDYRRLTDPDEPDPVEPLA